MHQPLFEAVITWLAGALGLYFLGSVVRALLSPTQTADRAKAVPHPSNPKVFAVLVALDESGEPFQRGCITVHAWIGAVVRFFALAIAFAFGWLMLPDYPIHLLTPRELLAAACYALFALGCGVLALFPRKAIPNNENRIVLAFIGSWSWFIGAFIVAYSVFVR